MRSLKASTGVVQDIRARAARRGRRPEDILFFQGVTPVVGGTEAEAKAKAADYVAQSSVDGGLAHMSGSVGVDLGAIDLDAPLASLETDAMQGVIRGLIESAPDKSLTFRDLVRSRASGQFLTGTPEQIADRFRAWHEAGVDGFNIVYAVTPGTFADFIESVVPELRRRGLVQSDYAPGTLREKLFGQSAALGAPPRRRLSTIERDHIMDADQLRSLQAPLKERYREDADVALIVLKASGAVDDSEIACSVDTGKALVEAGLHPSGGGTGLQACSGDMLLQALVACAGVTLRAVATALSIDIRHARVSAEGDLDVRGTLGVDRDAPVGFRAIRLHFALKSDAAPEDLEKLYKLTERYCVVYQTLTGGTPVTVSRSDN